MAETLTIARPYAEAVFGLGDASGTLANWSSALATMAAVAAAPEMREAIGNPKFAGEKLYGLFAHLCGEVMDARAQNLVRVLIDNDRLALLPEIRDIFEQLKNEREGVVEAIIGTAFPLDEGQLAALVAQLERRFKRKVQPRIVVDRELIGGARVQVGDEVIDGSVRGKLASMTAALKK